jgi:hypothetical protein
MSSSISSARVWSPHQAEIAEAALRRTRVVETIRWCGFLLCSAWPRLLVSVIREEQLKVLRSNEHAGCPVGAVLRCSTISW